MDTYIEKNRGFITSSKLKEFMRCQKCFKWKYLDEIPDPTSTGEFFDKDCFVIGQALDDRLTLGEKKFAKAYEVVAKRSKEAELIQLTKASGRTVNTLTKEFLANELFNHKPKKKILNWEYAGFKLRGELDDLDVKAKRINDIKSTANILTFNPDFYLLQGSFYQWGYEEMTGEKFEFALEIVDKYKYFSRSKFLVYTRGTLEGYRGTILQALEDLRFAQDTGIYAEPDSQNVKYECPYYGHEGHGRPTETIYY